MGYTFILIIAFIFLGIMTYFATNVFNKLRAQNVNVMEAIFLSFIYVVSYLHGRASSADFEISREKFWKLAGPLFIFIFGFLIILLITIIYTESGMW